MGTLENFQICHHPEHYPCQFLKPEVRKILFLNGILIRNYGDVKKIVDTLCRRTYSECVKITHSARGGWVTW